MVGSMSTISRIPPEPRRRREPPPPPSSLARVPSTLIADWNYLRNVRVPRSEAAYEDAVNAYWLAQMEWEDVRDDRRAPPADVRNALDWRNVADQRYDDAHADFLSERAAERDVLGRILALVAGGRANEEDLPSWASSAVAA